MKFIKKAERRVLLRNGIVVGNIQPYFMGQHLSKSIISWIRRSFLFTISLIKFKNVNRSQVGDQYDPTNGSRVEPVISTHPDGWTLATGSLSTETETRDLYPDKTTLASTTHSTEASSQAVSSAMASLHNFRHRTSW